MWLIAFVLLIFVFSLSLFDQSSLLLLLCLFHYYIEHRINKLYHHIQIVICAILSESN